jgi:hypothetical protein
VMYFFISYYRWHFSFYYNKNPLCFQ